MPQFTFVAANDYAKNIIKHKGRNGADLTPYVEPMSNLTNVGDGMYIDLSENDKVSTVKSYIKEAAAQLGIEIRFAAAKEENRIAFSRVVKARATKGE
jgi:hypothetical protein